MDDQREIQILADWERSQQVFTQRVRELFVALSELNAAAEEYRVAVNEWDHEHNEGTTEEEMDKAESRLLRKMEGARKALCGASWIPVKKKTAGEWERGEYGP